MKIASSDNTLAMQLRVTTSSPASVPESSANASTQTTTTKVEISKEGHEKLESEKYADIDNAPLPEDVKEVLKNIRKLQEKIAQKNQELMELMSDKTLSEDEIKRQREVLTTEIRSMQSALGTATNALNNAMSTHNMDSKGRSLAKGLIGMK
ncbi:hypothetical protein BK634_20050 [Pseudomonas chlororaphis]|jgi:peptidoglycan hydrolase CwlO-like protein|nr:hypothetical protein BK634_20050 [Pseudomonas chlororaphis]WEK07546.1 MAG: hypothetical protein P0Y51_19995 [Pseudomonas sp.]